MEIYFTGYFEIDIIVHILESVQQSCSWCSPLVGPSISLSLRSSMSSSWHLTDSSRSLIFLTLLSLNISFPFKSSRLCPSWSRGFLECVGEPGLELFLDLIPIFEFFLDRALLQDNERAREPALEGALDSCLVGEGALTLGS